MFLYDTYQFSFTPDIDTEEALYSATSYSALKKGLKTWEILLELAKVFDTIDHIELIKILSIFWYGKE